MTSSIWGDNKRGRGSHAWPKWYSLISREEAGECNESQIYIKCAPFSLDILSDWTTYQQLGHDHDESVIIICKFSTVDSRPTRDYSNF